MNKFTSLFICSLLFISQPVLAEDNTALSTTSARLKTTFEALSLPAGEHMGLLGGSFLFDTNGWLSLGGSSYGALSGERGGFITLGLAAELRTKLSRSVELNTGMFVGGGGGRGGNTLQGGGLMLRYHLGGQFNTQGLGSLGTGLSYVDFPNGNIDSLQPYLSYEYPFTTLFTAGGFSGELPITQAKNAIAATNQEFSSVYHQYNIPADVLAENGSPQHDSLSLMGVEWDRYLNEKLFLKIESAGAMDGENNGYMQLLLGGGGRLRLAGSTALKLSAAAGYAGGGNVAMGGGLLLKSTLSLQQYLSRHWFAEVSAGYVAAPDGDFKANNLSAKIGYLFKTPSVTEDEVPLSRLAGFAPHNLRIRTVHQTYLEGASGWRNHHADQNVNLLGFQLDSFINEYLYLSGQGIAAYQGQAGGYMTGLVGAGAELPLFDSPLSLELEALIGAAGGGGLEVAGGLVWQTNLGLGYQVSDTYSVIGSYGYMSAPQGELRAKVIGLSLACNFSIFTKI